MKSQNLSLIIFLFALCFFNSKSDTFPNINHIISYKLNGTAAFASLEYIDSNEQYLYFSFDFKFHDKDLAYFMIDSDLEINVPDKEKISFGFSERVWTEIKSKKDIENIHWKQLNHRYKIKQYSYINYYYKVERLDEQMNTLLIRIPINGRDEGYITVANIKDFSYLD